MWKASLQKAVKEVRFVLKPSADHHGVWKFVRTTLPEIRSLNPNTFFQVQEITDQLKTESACHIVYGDGAWVDRNGNGGIRRPVYTPLTPFVSPTLCSLPLGQS